MAPTAVTGGVVVVVGRHHVIIRWTYRGADVGVATPRPVLTTGNCELISVAVYGCTPSACGQNIYTGVKFA